MRSVPNDGSKVVDESNSNVSAERSTVDPSASEAMLAAFPGGAALDLGFDLAHSASGRLSSFLTARSGHASAGHGLPTALGRPAVVLGALAGTVLGAVGGNAELWNGPGSIPCGVAGAFAGGTMGFAWEYFYLQSDPQGEEQVAGVEKKAEDEAKNETIELPEPALEKLHQLALTAVALADYEEDLAKLDGNETEASLERADERKAIKALDDIVKRQNSSKREPMNRSNGDLEDIQEVLSEGDTSEFVTAEAALANNALMTANDLARVAGKNGSSVRGEDLGPAGDMKSFQGDMVPGSSEQLLLFQRSAESSDATAPVHRRRDSKAEGVEDQVVTAAGAVWKGAKVNYCFASDVTEHVRHIFLAATNQYEVAIPCMEFVDVGWKRGRSTSPEYSQKCKESPAIFVQSNPREGCYSYVGMVERPGLHSQRLQLQDPGCVSIGTAIHELGHALGMAHEQSRPDRNKHVKIHFRNIQYGMEHNFDIDDNAYTGAAYDLLSIMHYDRFAFARNPDKPTIEYVGSGVHDELGQRAGLSSYDVSQMAAMYKEEATDCKATALAGMGCINKPNDAGKDICNMAKCNSMGAKHCCGCGGGIQVQCYKGQDCPKSDPLPDLDDSECIEDSTHLFKGQGYPCIYTNVCKFNVEFTCPGLDCSHKVRPKSYEAAQCNRQFQTKICTARKECKVTRI